MAPSIPDIRVLLRRGERSPVIMALTASRLAPGKLVFSGGYVVGETMIFLTDPEGIEMRRTFHSLQVLREGRDILRRTPHHCWVFENFGDRIDPPIRLTPSGITCPSALAWFLRQHSIARALPSSLWGTEQITPGEIIGRPTWVLREKSATQDLEPDRLISLEIDQEHGVLLAVETGQERIEVTEISFPGSLPDPAWDGQWRPLYDPDVLPSTAPDTAEIPGYLEVLPPQSDDPRRLRVFVGEMELEGAFPDYRIGHSIRLSLGISSLPAPVAGLSTTRRGRVHNLGEVARPGAQGTPRWPIELTGDGWTALAHTPTPVRGEAEIKGWFYYSAYGMIDVPTDLRVERIFAGIGTRDSDHRLWQEVDTTSPAYQDEKWRIRDVVLDVTLDGAVPPPLRREHFTGLDPVVAGQALWLCDVHLPVARCWDTVTGRYLGQSLVPAPMRDLYPVLELHVDQQSKVVAASVEQGWTLTPGQAVATTIPDWQPLTQATDLPEVPSPWEVRAVRGERLYELQALTDTGVRTALARVTTAGDLEITELPPAGYGISSVVQIKDEYIVGRWVQEYRLNADLEVTSVRDADISAPGWKAKGPIAYLWEDDHVRFLNRASGSELPGLEITEGHQARVLSATVTEIVVLTYRRNPYHSMSILPIAVATYREAVWTTVPLQEAPAEMF